MELNNNTKLGDVLKAYPWLIDEAVKLDERLTMLKNPIGRAMVKNMTVTDVCKKAGIEETQAIEMVEKLIREHLDQNS